MNFFAHGRHYVDRPYLLAGTAVPDWLSVADRGVRLRSPRVEPFADGTGSPRAELAAGVLRHLDDDAWFHQTAAFFETTGEVARSFRRILGSDDGFRPGFLGHITVELLLDAVLIDDAPALLDRYYEAMQQLDAGLIQESVNQMAVRPTQSLAIWIQRFRTEQFLRDYSDPKRLLYRLNQVMHRIKLDPLPEAAEAALASGRLIVQDRAADLLRQPPRQRENSEPESKLI